MVNSLRAGTPACMLLLLLHTRKKRWRRLKNSRHSPHISLEKFKVSANSDCFTFHNRALGKREKCVCVCTTRGGRACSCRVQNFNMGLTKISLRRGGGQKRSFSAIWRQKLDRRQDLLLEKNKKNSYHFFFVVSRPSPTPCRSKPREQSLILV